MPVFNENLHVCPQLVTNAAFIMSLVTNWGLDLAINGNGWKQTANDDLIESVCYLPLLAVAFRHLTLSKYLIHAHARLWIVCKRSQQPFYRGKVH